MIARHKQIVVGLVLLLFVGVILFNSLWAEFFSAIHSGPPRYFMAIQPIRITNINDHFARWGQPEAIFHGVRSGTNIYILVGLTNKFPVAFPSGPPAYVYSDSGAFLDWSFDLGDDPGVHQRWSNLWPNESDHRLTTNEVDQLMERFSPPSPASVSPKSN